MNKPMPTTQKTSLLSALYHRARMELARARCFIRFGCCESVNHVKAGPATWRCERCGQTFCAFCEGGWDELCDGCWGARNR